MSDAFQCDSCGDLYHGVPPYFGFLENNKNGKKDFGDIQDPQNPKGEFELCSDCGTKFENQLINDPVTLP